MGEIIASEFQEQVMLVQWLDLMGLKYSSIPNSTWTSSIKQKVRNKQSGLRPGLPDLLIALPGTGLLFIELKRTKQGVVSKAQQDWIDTINSCPGAQAYVCKGFEAAKAVIEQFIVIRPSVGQRTGPELVF